MIYITGDTHGKFERVEAFCEWFKTSKDDILIILGDAGINFSGEIYDTPKKEMLESLPITIFSIHGNHEQRPYTIASYKEKVWHGGTVFVEEKYPSLLFAKDGEIFDLDGKKTIVIFIITAILFGCFQPIHGNWDGASSNGRSWSHSPRYTSGRTSCPSR